jgi:hypothetical protein
MVRRKLRSATVKSTRKSFEKKRNIKLYSPWFSDIADRLVIYLMQRIENCSVEWRNEKWKIPWKIQLKD